MPYLGAFGLELENNIVIFKITTLEYVWLQNFVKKMKMRKFETKMPYLDTFGLEFQNATAIFEITTLEFV